uniref:Uncharacterized protein n=1 Tax=Chrysotila carterae TaxID=13221 RepID=A0A7S4B5R8_CHRCT|mmetsp:Transcript_29788/g.62690  ORF Transcript_29788/g.62690 Transcript_29788/m.62690 type:complete len:211 (-) Transcript_29788:342-974(-)
MASAFSLLVLGLNSVDASRLAPASPSAANIAASSAAASFTTPLTRRHVISFARVAALGALSGGVSQAFAYDSIPTATPDFAAAEKARKEREVLIEKETAALIPYVEKIEAATNADTFEKAADELALYVIGKGAIADGVNIKRLVARIRTAYEALPQFGYTCPKGQEKRDNALCYSPGVTVENAYGSLMKELRKYSMIQLGDFRKVQMSQF